MTKNNLLYKCISAAFIVSIFAGCTTTGSTQLDSLEKKELKQKIVKNKSSMQDILEALGEPTSTKITAQDKEIWTYNFSSSRETIPSYIPLVNDFSKGVTQKSKKLVIYFNKKKIVKNYTYSSKNIEKNTGYLH